MAVLRIKSVDNNIEAKPQEISYNYDEKFTKNCEENGEWDMIAFKEVYIKRSAVYYFIDANILKIIFMTQDGPIEEQLKNRFDFTVTMIKKNKTVAEEIIKKNVNVYRYGNAVEYLVAYFQMKLDASSELLKMYEKKEFDSMSVVIFDKSTKLRTRNSLNVKIKYLMGDKAKKKGMMRCGKCSYVMRNSDLADLDWWIRIHQAMGYDKVYLCGQMVDKEQSFNSLVIKYKDLLEVETMKCIPNLQPHAYLANVTFLKYNTEMTNGQVRQFDRIKFYAFEYLNVNECHNNNIDKYRHITIYDTDEFVLAKKLRQYNTFDSVKDFVSNIDKDRFSKLQCESNLSLANFIENDLKPRLNISQDISIHFKHGSYLSNEIIDELFKSLRLNEQIMINESLKDDTMIKLSIDVLNGDRAKQFKLDGPVSFTINGRGELNYALGLMKLYDLYIQPFLRNHETQLKTKAGKYNRLFFVSGDRNYPLVGKSAMNTRRIMDVFIHYGFGHMNIRMGKDGREEVDVHHGPRDMADPAVNNKDFIVPREMAHLSHCRDRFEINTQGIPFSSLHFDLNYFKCYMGPFLTGSSV
jgi:hypothetical protein